VVLVNCADGSRSSPALKAPTHISPGQRPGNLFMGQASRLLLIAGGTPAPPTMIPAL
jgi:hypothetical protein